MVRGSWPRWELMAGCHSDEEMAKIWGRGIQKEERSENRIWRTLEKATALNQGTTKTSIVNNKLSNCLSVVF